jgi:hypothetical protein
MFRRIFNTKCITINKLGNNNSIKRLYKLTPNVGNALGQNFERDVQDILLKCGYRSTYDNNNADAINSVFINTNKIQSEFDAIVSGRKHSFEYLQNSFDRSFTKFPPNSDAHSAIVEIKLNFNAVRDWIKAKKSGNRYLFFDSNPLFTKILVINGGEDSEDFVKSLSSDDCKDEYKEAKAAIIDFKINVFYKVWASAEAFVKISKDFETLKTDYETLKTDYETLKTEHETLKIEHETLKTEHVMLKKDHEVLKNDIILLKKHLNIK